jgi:hypothetical protein
MFRGHLTLRSRVWRVTEDAYAHNICEMRKDFSVALNRGSFAGQKMRRTTHIPSTDPSVVDTLPSLTFPILRLTTPSIWGYLSYGVKIEGHICPRRCV